MMPARFSAPVLAHSSDVEFFQGPGCPAVCVDVPHGRGRRRIAVVLPDDVLEILGRLSRVPTDRQGHLLWHLQNKRPVPCASCTPEAR